VGVLTSLRVLTGCVTRPKRPDAAWR